MFRTILSKDFKPISFLLPRLDLPENSKMVTNLADGSGKVLAELLSGQALITSNAEFCVLTEAQVKKNFLICIEQQFFDLATLAVKSFSRLQDRLNHIDTCFSATEIHAIFRDCCKSEATLISAFIINNAQALLLLRGMKSRIMDNVASISDKQLLEAFSSTLQLKVQKFAKKLWHDNHILRRAIKTLNEEHYDQGYALFSLVLKLRGPAVMSLIKAEYCSYIENQKFFDDYLRSYSLNNALRTMLLANWIRLNPSLEHEIAANKAPNAQIISGKRWPEKKNLADFDTKDTLQIQLNYFVSALEQGENAMHLLRMPYSNLYKWLRGEVLNFGHAEDPILGKITVQESFRLFILSLESKQTAIALLLLENIELLNFIYKRTQASPKIHNKELIHTFYLLLENGQTILCQAFLNMQEIRDWFKCNAVNFGDDSKVEYYQISNQELIHYFQLALNHNLKELVFYIFANPIIQSYLIGYEIDSQKLMDEPLVLTNEERDAILKSCYTNYEYRQIYQFMQCMRPNSHTIHNSQAEVTNHTNQVNTYQQSIHMQFNFFQQPQPCSYENASAELEAQRNCFASN